MRSPAKWTGWVREPRSWTSYPPCVCRRAFGVPGGKSRATHLCANDSWPMKSGKSNRAGIVASRNRGCRECRSRSTLPLHRAGKGVEFTRVKKVVDYCQCWFEDFTVAPYCCQMAASRLYRTQAEVCETTAKLARPPSLRAQYLSLASRWRELADDQDRLEARSLAFFADQEVRRARLAHVLLTSALSERRSKS
jgi:hypothetical protein